MDGLTMYVLGVIFVATIVRSAFGFGEALVAVPLLVLRLPLATAAPLAVLVSITIAGLVVVQDWRKIHFASAGWLVFATLFGIPLGLLLLINPHQRIVKMALALVIIVFGAWSIKSFKTPHLKTDNKAWLFGCGFFAGILGGAYGMNGPPIAIYGSMRGWSPQHFRATLQGYFLPASILGMIGYRSEGLWGSAVTHYYLMALPVTILATWLGRLLNHRVQLEIFRKYVYAGVMLLGAALAIQAAVF